MSGLALEGPLLERNGPQQASAWPKQLAKWLVTVVAGVDEGRR